MKALIAFDADKHAPRHEGVLRGEKKLIDALLPICEVATAEWNRVSGKGIDDLLIAGGTFRRVECRRRPVLRPRVPRPCAEPGAVDGGASLQDAEEETAARIARRFTAAYRDTRALIGPPPGLSKTGSVLREQEVATMNVLWAVSRHEQAAELLARAESEPCRCGKARGNCSEHALSLVHDFGRSPDNCANFEVVAAAQEAGYGKAVGWAICGTPKEPICRFRNACAYQEQLGRPGSHVAPIETVIQRATGVGETRVVFIDDVEGARLVTRIHITRVVIERALSTAVSAEVTALVRIAQSALGQATRDGVYHADAYDLLDDAAREAGTTLEVVVADIPAASMLIPEPTVEGYTFALPGQLIDLIALLQEELPLYQSGKSFTSGLRVHANGIEVVKLNVPATDAEGRNTFTGKSVGVLTATPDPITRQWLGRLGGEVVSEFVPRVSLPTGVRVVQDVGAFYGKGAVLNRSNEVLLGRARAYIDEFRPNFPGVITHKAITEQVSEALEIPRERVLHFGGQRGSNILRDADLLLIVGTPSMDPNDAYFLACAAFRGEGAPPSPQMALRAVRYAGWRDVHGMGREVDVLNFIDPRVAEIYETARRDELIQAVHRIRPYDLERPDSARKGVTVVLLTEHPIEGLRVDDMRFSGNAARREEARERINVEVERMQASGEQVHARSLAKRAGTSKDQAAALLHGVSAACPPTAISRYTQVGGQTAEVVSRRDGDPPPACTCARCPAHQGDACNCGLFWFDGPDPWARPHCGVHWPRPVVHEARP